MARRVTTLRRGSRRHNNAWLGLVSSGPTTLAANSVVLAGTIVLSNSQIDETVLRVVGGISIASDSAAVEEQVGAVGLIVVSNAAIAIGVTAIPLPGTDADDDGWFCHTLFQQTSSRAVEGGQNSNMYNFSSKAKRVVEDGTGIAIVVQNGHATHGLNFTLQFRILTRITGT